MKYLKQFGIIIGISFVGEILHRVIPLPVPASIYGIVLLFVLLESKILPIDSVRETGKFLVEIMPVMFIPAAVGLIDSWNLIQNAWLSYLIVTLLSTCVVMVVTGRVTQRVIRSKRNKTEKEGRS